MADVEVAQIVDERARIGSLVDTEREPSRSRRIAHDRRLGRLAFEGSCRRAELGLDHYSVTVLASRVGSRSVCVGATALAMEVTCAVAATRWRLVRAVLGAEALHRRPCRNLRAVDRAVLVR
jgi:hypothetical protein